MKDQETKLLEELLQQQPLASLATLHDGQPAVSMVPYICCRDGQSLAIHVSSLASHSKDMQQSPSVGLLVMAPPAMAETPLALPRVSFQGIAQTMPPESDDYQETRTDYLARFPESEPLFSFTDFSLVQIRIKSIRFIAGFGRAMPVDLEAFAAAVTPANAHQPQ